MNEPRSRSPHNGNGSRPTLHAPPGHGGAGHWKRAVVVVSGRPEGDEALAYAAAIAAERGMEVVAVYLDTAGGALERAAHYADAAHHEYSSQLDEFVARALPNCTPEECATIRGIVLCSGEPVAALRRVMDEQAGDVLVIGTSGGATDGDLVEKLTRGAQYPVLVVKTAGDVPFRLKVGDWLG